MSSVSANGDSPQPKTAGFAQAMPVDEALSPRASGTSINLRATSRRMYRRALVIRFGGMGDIILATPTLRALHETYPGIEIDLVVGGGMGDSVRGNPYLRDVIVFDKRGDDASPGRFIAFLLRLARNRYDLVVNLHPSVKSHLMTIAAAPRKMLVFRKRIMVGGAVQHAINDFIKELKPLGVTNSDSSYLDFSVPVSARSMVAELLAAHGVNAVTRLVVLNPAASHVVNRWEADRFRQVAAHFAAQPNTRVVVTGAPSSFRTEMCPQDDATLAATVADGNDRIINVAGRLSVKELGALLMRADAFLTCDTGPMHVGSALGTPMVVLFGPADPDRTGPCSDAAIVLNDRSLPCMPCRKRTCARGDVACMQNLTVKAVIAAMQDRLDTLKRPDIAVRRQSTPGGV